jgi:hypothetical protein
MSDEELPIETLERLDASTLWLIRLDLLKHMRGLESLAKTGVLSKEDCAPRADTLRAMAAHYMRWWEKITNIKDCKGKELGKELAPLIPREDPFLYDSNGAIADRLATAIGTRHMTWESISQELPGSAREAALALEVLRCLAKPGGRFLLDGIGRYRVNPRWKPDLGVEAAMRKTPARKDVPHIVTKPARDFMAQTVSFALDERAGSASAHDVVQRIKNNPAAMRLLAGKAPTKQQVADVLSAHSRGNNPRYVRVARGLYKNNLKYKKPK